MPRRRAWRSVRWLRINEYDQMGGRVMEYIELISKLQALPREKQAEVFEFVNLLSERCGASADKPLKRAEAAAKNWNSFNKRIGSFADQHSTL